MFCKYIGNYKNYKNKNSINLDMWNAANKILGILHLDKSDSGKFRPLEINFDKHRVSFEKGCFRGQEIVARMKYLGIDRRKFCTFIVNNDFIEMNQCIDHQISIKYEGQECVNCNKERSIFRMGYCKKCFFDFETFFLHGNVLLFKSYQLRIFFVII